MNLSLSVRVALLLCFAIYSSIATSAPSGRLFFSADERAAMSALRDAPRPAAPAVVTNPPLPAKQKARQVANADESERTSTRKSKQPPKTEILTGFVQRSSGKTTRWINNQPEHSESGYGELDPLEVGKRFQRN